MTGPLRRPRRLGLGFVGVPATAALLVACSPAAVGVGLPNPDPAAATACARLHAALPDALDGHERRRVRPSSDLVAAWGDPAIVLRCGVGLPAAYEPTSELLTVNGVDWLPEQLTRGYRFTSIGRTARVEVSVPHRYAPEVNPVTDLSTLVEKMIPVTATAAPQDGSAPS